MTPEEQARLKAFEAALNALLAEHRIDLRPTYTQTQAIDRAGVITLEVVLGIAPVLLPLPVQEAS